MRCVTNKPGSWRLGVAAALAASCWVRQSFAEVQPLRELEQRALVNRASLISEHAKVRAAAAQVEMARAPRYPTLGARAEAWAGPGGRLVRIEDVNGEEFRVAGSRTLGDSGAFTPEPRYGATLALSSELYDFGRTSAAIRAAEAEVGAAEAGVLAEQRSIVHVVRAAYLDWLAAHAARAIARENIEISELQRRALEGRVAEGTLREAELANIRYEQAELDLALSQSEADLGAARAALEYASQSRLTAGAEPDYGVLDPAAPAPRSEQDPQIRALEARRNAALNSARAERLARAPVLSAGAEAGLAAQGSTFVPMYRVGVSLSLPLLDGGLSSAAAERAEAQAEELSLRARTARGEAAFMRAQADAELAQADARIRLAGELVTLAQAALAQSEEQFRAGRGGFELVTRARFRVSDARQKLVAARVAAARVRFQLLPSTSQKMGSTNPTR